MEKKLSERIQEYGKNQNEEAGEFKISALTPISDKCIEYQE